MTKLFEGMWANDLEDLVQPIVSIDEYQSKVDSTAIAVGFFVDDRDAANDLNRFIQKSAVPIIDSDISPAPDQRGYYLVFAELQGNDRFVDNLIHLCDEVGQLSGITKWSMSMRGIKHIMPIDKDAIRKAFIRNSIVDKLSVIQHEITELKSR